MASIQCLGSIPKQFEFAISYLLTNSTLSVNPDAQLKNNPQWGTITNYFPAPDQDSGISWNDPYRINGFQRALKLYGAFSKGVVDFSTGFNDGFRSSILLEYDPNYVPTGSTNII
jgi:hypothetical protein